MTLEQLCQRADILGTQVITRDTGKRLGIVTQLWVDIDRREVVAFGLRENILSTVMSNIQQTMLLSDVQQVGDVILVNDDTVLDGDIDVETYNSLINCEVITETGELLGKVRGFKFNANDGRVTSIVIASVGLPQIPDQVISTYELSMEEVVSSGPDRLIVFEGSEDKLIQLSVGVLERLGIGNAPWERENDDYYVMPTSPANQLGTGSTTAAPEVLQTATTEARETWDEDNWNQAPPQPLQEPLRQPELVYEDNNWGGDQEAYPQKAAYIEEASYEEYQESQAEESPYEDYDVTGDAWEDDDSPKPYRPQKINIPEKKRVVEYEEETDY